MAILYGTTGDGTTLPVLVDQFGNLLAKGIPGDEGPPGPPGAPGGDFALPANPADGDVLGWENGALVWISEPPPPLDPGFVPVIYTGNGGTQSISSLPFQPDFVFIKARNAGYNYVLFDSVRGTGGAKVLFSNNTSAEGGSSGQEGTVYGHVSAFNSNGFTVAAGTGTPLWVSNSGTNYIAWCWKAGGAAVSNTDGTITSSVSANTAYGFSIVGYTGNGTGGSSIGHGLNAPISFIIFKNLSDTENWFVWHNSFPSPTVDGLYLDLTANVQNFGGTSFNSTLPSSSVITLGNANIVNGSTDDMIAYCWAEIPEISSFGSYIGNGSATGPVVNCGFKPSFLMIKASSINGEDWVILDSARNPSDPKNSILKPNTSQGEFTSDAYNVDFTDSGFSILNTNPRFNGSGTYIYAAFK